MRPTLTYCSSAVSFESFTVILVNLPELFSEVALFAVLSLHGERHRKRKKWQLLKHSLEEVVALRSVPIKAHFGFLSGAGSLALCTWDRQGCPAPVPYPLSVPGSLSLLHLIGLAFLLLTNLF